MLHALGKKGDWNWVVGETAATAPDSCIYVHGNTYTSCLGTGKFWVDSPDSRADCMGLDSVTGTFGWNIDIWDMKRYRTENAACLRHSEKEYKTFVKATHEKEGARSPDEAAAEEQ